MSTTQKITDLLNREPLTVIELATRLGISRNSVHQHVTRLHAAGVLVLMPDRAPEGAGKPARQYRTAARNEDFHSEAYKPVLASLIQTISTDLTAKQRVNVLENTGRALAQAAGLEAKGNLKTDIQKSVDAVNSLGAMAELEQEGNNFRITCFSCPVASLVHSEPMTCRMVAAFFSEASGKQVTVDCRKDETVVCGFNFED